MSWPIAKLGDVCRFVRGPFGGALKKDYFVEDGYAVYEQQHAINNQFNKIRYFIDTEKFEEMKRFELSPGDLIMSCSGTMGKIAIVPEGIKPGIINQALLKLSPRNKIDTTFLRYWLQSASFQYLLDEHTHGAAIKNVASVSVLKDLEIPLPPLPEQKRIAAILDKADSLRRKNQQAIQLADKFLRAVFLDMFGDPVTNPKGWIISFLSEVCIKITDGTHHSPPIMGTGIPYITAKHIKQTGVEFFNDPWFISRESHKDIFSRCNPERHDVLYIKDGATTGLAAINEYDFEFSMLSSLALLKPNKAFLLPEFLTMFLNHPRSKSMIIANMAGAAITRLTLAKIKEIQIPIPPIAEQQKFSLLYWNVKALLKKTRNCVEFSDNEFNSLSQKAFAGKL